MMEQTVHSSNSPFDADASFFSKVEQTPGSELFELTGRYKLDRHENATNLAIGVWQNERGRVLPMETVSEVAFRLAGERLLVSRGKTPESDLWTERELSGGYLPMTGYEPLNIAARGMVFGEELSESERIVTIQAFGGTGALHLGIDFAHAMRPQARILMDELPWENHPGLAEKVGIEIVRYRSYDSRTRCGDFGMMMDTVRKAARRGDLLLLQLIDNPTGETRTLEQYKTLSEFALKKGITILFDTPYQGFGDGFEKDAAPIRLMVEAGNELLVAQSMSKTFARHDGRLGALHLVGSSKGDVLRARKFIAARGVRREYSNAVSDPALCASRIWGDPELRSLWLSELAGRAERVVSMRSFFAEKMEGKGPFKSIDVNHVTRQKGLVSLALAGLSPEFFSTLEHSYHVYVPKNGRVNFGALTEGNIDWVCKAIEEAYAATE